MTDDITGTIEDSALALTPEEEAAVSPPAEEGVTAPEVASGDGGGDGGPSPAADQPQNSGEEQPQMVPLATLLGERKSFQAKMQDLQADQVKRFEEVMARAFPGQAEEPEAPAPMPDPLTEPEAFASWMEKRISDGATALKEQQDQQQKTFQEQQAEAQQAAMVNNANLQEQAFAAKTPDYYDAFKHLRDARIAEIKMINPTAADDQISQHLAQETMSILQQATAAGVNPAEMFYNLAKGRGWAAPEADRKSEVEQVNKANEAAAGVGSASGAGANKITAAQIANMSEDELEKLPDDVFNAAMAAA